MDDLEECKNCKKSFKQLVRHISLAKKCKEYYGSELDELKEKSRKESKKRINAKHNNANREEINKRQRTYNAANRESIIEQQRTYNAAHADEIREKQAIRNNENVKESQTKKDKMVPYDRILAFKQEIIDGPMTLWDISDPQNIQQIHALSTGSDRCIHNAYFRQNTIFAACIPYTSQLSPLGGPDVGWGEPVCKDSFRGLGA